MKFSRIYRETKLFWPSSVLINDGELRSSGGGYFPSLSKAWDKAEESAEKWSEWHQLMVWAIFGGFHSLAIREFEKGSLRIMKKDIDCRYIEEKFAENLFTDTQPGYPRQMRRAYKNDLKS